MEAETTTELVERSRIDRMVDVLSYASVGSFSDAVASSVVSAEDAFGVLEEALRLVCGELLEARLQNEQAMRSLEQSRTELQEQLETIENQRLAIEDLSTPILDIWTDVITLPVIGSIDSQRAAEMTERLLRRISEGHARCVIIDLTGVEAMDTATADHLVKMTKASRLLGCFCVITGVGPVIARTLVSLDLDLGEIQTLRNLKSGLEACFAHLAGLRARDARPADSAVKMARSNAGGRAGETG